MCSLDTQVQYNHATDINNDQIRLTGVGKSKGVSTRSFWIVPKSWMVCKRHTGAFKPLCRRCSTAVSASFFSVFSPTVNVKARAERDKIKYFHSKRYFSNKLTKLFQ